MSFFGCRRRMLTTYNTRPDLARAASAADDRARSAAGYPRSAYRSLSDTRTQTSFGHWADEDKIDVSVFRVECLTEDWKHSPMEPHLNALTDTQYCPLWHDQHVRPERCPPLSGDDKCELLIVGAGFTGLWAALQATERMPSLDIILIESTFVGSGASGRNGGMLTKALAHGDSNLDHHFPNEADRIDTLGKLNYQEILESLDRYDIDARFEHAGYMKVAARAYQVEALRRFYEQKAQHDATVTWHDQDDVQRMISSPSYKAGVHLPGRGGILDPARLCWELKRTLLNLEVRIFETTPMLRFSVHDTGVKTDCPNASIRSDRLLMATNAFPNPLGRIRKSVIPVWDYQLATEPLSSSQRESIGWKDPFGVSDFDNMFHYSPRPQNLWVKERPRRA